MEFELLPKARIALNPIQWMATSDGWLDPALAPPPKLLMKEVARAGFLAMHSQVPNGWSVPEYASALADSGLAPAPGYLSLGLASEGVTLEETLGHVREAAFAHKLLGLRDIFIASRMRADGPRVGLPAIGHAFDEARFAEVHELISFVANELTDEGLRPALHPHIGSWIETEQETRRLLDAIGPDVLWFGPDTGHLSWAAADVGLMLADYRERINVVHVKDCNVSRCRFAVEAGLDYRATVTSGIWAEPGRGELDLKSLLGELGLDFDGWLIAEVDYSSLPPFASACISADWFRSVR